jgi:hypothetical protein
MTEDYAYVDKTRFIDFLENEPTKFHFLIRPHKFGKSLFLSVLQHCYDIGKAHLFDILFGNLYIGKNPTPKKQLHRYKISAEFISRTDVRYLSVIFFGGKKYEVVEV